MTEHIGWTRITLRNGTTYAVTEHIDTVFGALQDADFVDFSSVTGQQAFSPERLILRCDEIATVQEISPESWIWQKRAAELHYARQIAESPDQERLIRAHERMVDVLAGEVGGDDE